MVQISNFRFLKSYFKDIDTANLQLQLLRHGRVVLEKLELAEEILDQYDVPFRLVAGQIRRVEISITSWHRIFSSPLLVKIDGVSIFLAPRRSLPRDGDDEYELKHWRKKRDEQIESLEAKLRRDSGKVENIDTDASQVKPLSWLEKMMLTMLKNAEISITNVHVRYEDHWTFKAGDFSFGLMQESISLKSFEPDDAEPLTERFFKSIEFINFAIYLDLIYSRPNDWYNSGESSSSLYQRLLTDVSELSTKTKSLKHDFVIRPMLVTARMKVNARPELTQFQDPIVDLQINFGKLPLQLNQSQCRAIVRNISAFNSQSQSQRRLWQYRPSIPCRGIKAARNWWRYAAACVAENDSGEPVFSINNMTNLLQLRKDYRQLYCRKLTENWAADDPGEAKSRLLQSLEDRLDPFNIVLQRNLAKAAVQRIRASSSVSSASTGEPDVQLSWWSSWYWRGRGWLSNANVDFEAALTEDDKKQLIDQLGSKTTNDNDVSGRNDNMTFILGLKLQTLDVTLLSESRNATADFSNRPIFAKTVARLTLASLNTQFGIRQNYSFWIHGECQRLNLIGLDGVSIVDAPIQQTLSDGNKALSQNGVGRSCVMSFDYHSRFMNTNDQKLEIDSQPVAVTLHSLTLTNLIEMFNVPDNSMALSDLASGTVQEIKERSAAFAKAITESQRHLRLRVILRGGYLILPETGTIQQANQILVVDFGALSIFSETKQSYQKMMADVSLAAESLDEVVDEVDAVFPPKRQSVAFEELKNNAYNRLEVSVKHVQVFMCDKTVNWYKVEDSSENILYLVPPLYLNAKLESCVIRDPRLPKLRLELSLPPMHHPNGLAIEIVGSSLRRTLKLLQSIPALVSSNKDSPPSSEIKTSSIIESPTKLSSFISTKDEDALSNLLAKSSPNRKLLELSFSLDSLKFQVTDENIGAVFRMVVEKPQFEFCIESHSTSGSFSVNAFYVQHLKANSPIVNAIIAGKPASTNDESLSGNSLLSISFVVADPMGPDYVRLHRQQKAQLNVDVGDLEILLYREALLDSVHLIRQVTDFWSLPSENGVSVIGSDTRSKRPLSLEGLLSINPISQPFYTGLSKRQKKRLTTFSVGIKVNRISAALKADNLGRFGCVVVDKVYVNVSRLLFCSTLELGLSAITVESFSEGGNFGLRLLQSLSTTFASKAAISLKFTIWRRRSLRKTVVAKDSISGKFSAFLCYVDAQFIKNVSVYLRTFENLLQTKSKGSSDAASDEDLPDQEGLLSLVDRYQKGKKKLDLEVETESSVLCLPRVVGKCEDCVVVHLGKLFISNNSAITQKDEEPLSGNSYKFVANIGVEGFRISRCWPQSFDFLSSGNLQFANQRVIFSAVNLRVVAAILSLSNQQSEQIESGQLQLFCRAPPLEVSMCFDDCLVVADISQWINNNFLTKLSNENLEAMAASTADVSVHREAVEIVIPSTSSHNNDIRANAKSFSVGCNFERISVRLFHPEKSNTILSLNVLDMAVSLSNYKNGDHSAEFWLSDFAIDDSSSADRPIKIVRRWKGSSASENKPVRFMTVTAFKPSHTPIRKIDIRLNDMAVIFVPNYAAKLIQYLQSNTGNLNSLTAVDTLVKTELTVTLARTRLLFVRDTINTSNAIALQFELESSITSCGQIVSAETEMKRLAIYFGSFEALTSSTDLADFQCIMKPVRFLNFSFAKESRIKISGQGGDVTMNFTPLGIRSVLDALGQLHGAVTATDNNSTALLRNKVEPIASEDTELGQAYPLSKFSLPCFQPPDPSPLFLSLKSTLQWDVSFTLPCVTVKFSTNAAQKMVPLIQLRSAIGLEVSIATSGCVNMSADLDMEVAYYNSRRYVWEPLVEPIECKYPDVHPLQRPLVANPSHRRAKFSMHAARTIEVANQFTFDSMPAFPVIGDDPESAASPKVPRPELAISIVANDVLQLVVSKSGLLVLTKLLATFFEVPTVTSSSAPVSSSGGASGYASRPACFLNETDVNFALYSDGVIKLADLVRSTSLSVSLSPDHSHIDLPPNCSPVMVDLVPTYGSFKASIRQLNGTVSQLEKSKRLMTLEAQRSYTFYIEAAEFSGKSKITVAGASSKLFRVGNPSANVRDFLCHVSAHDDGTMVMKLTSTVKVWNHLDEPVDVVSESNSSVTLEPGQIRYLPYNVAKINGIPKLFVKPSRSVFSPVPVSLSKENQRYTLAFQNSNDGRGDGTTFYLAAFLEVVKVENCCEALPSGQTHHLHIGNAIQVQNLLPFAVNLSETNGGNTSSLLEPGCIVGLGHSLGHSNCSVTLKLPSYCDMVWSATLSFGKVDTSKITFITFSSSNSDKLELALYATKEYETLKLSLFAPYWMINRTGLHLSYKFTSSDVIFDHSERDHTPLLLSLADTSIEKRKMQIKVDESDWCNKFSVDAVGSVSTIACQSMALDGQHAPAAPGNHTSSTASVLCCAGRVPVRNYLIGMTINMTGWGLSKSITFTPYFFLVNKCQFGIECQEKSLDGKRYSVKSNQCAPFWPREMNPKKQRMVVIEKDTDKTSQPFLYSEKGSTLLKFDSTFRGINVTTSVYDGAVHIVFESYAEGMSPLLIANDTKSMQLEYFQEKASSKSSLKPNEGVLFHWSLPDRERVLKWSARIVDQTQQPSSLQRRASMASNAASATNMVNFSGFETGVFRLGDAPRIFWATFINKGQRVLLFSEDKSLIKRISGGHGEVEKMQITISLNVAALGISLVDNVRGLELAYATISPQNSWEYKKLKHAEGASSSSQPDLVWRPFKPKQALILEKRYLEHATLAAPKDSLHSLDKQVSVNLVTMQGVRKGKPISVRRTYVDGLECRVGFSRRHRYFHSQLGHVRVDNQVLDGRFQTALLPVPPPIKGKGSKELESSSQKPFLQLSIIVQPQPDSQMLIYKYVKLLVQEMALKVDLPFVALLYSFFASADQSEEEKLQAFKFDLENIAKPLENTYLGPDFLSGTKHFFEILHISPLKVHLSFSPHRNSSQSLSNNAGIDSLLMSDAGSLLLSSIGLVTGDVQEAVFRLAYYEKTSAFMTWPQFINGLWKHYLQHGLKQFFSLLLGMDVLPVASVARSFASGVENLFYEPWQGAVEGPEELLRGMGRGLRGFFGKTVAGVSGGIGKVTGTIGHAAVKLTFDSDFQAARRVERSRHKSAGRHLLSGVSSLASGIVEGATGLVVKPIHGARRGGVAGFFKGLGVGAVGIFMRPTVGVIDFTSTSFYAIQQLVDNVEELRRMRPPRLIGKDGTVRPYLFAESQANYIMLQAAKGRFKDELYLTHLLLLQKDGRQSLMIATENGLFTLSTSELLEEWECKSAYAWSEVENLPSVDPSNGNLTVTSSGKKLTIGACNDGTGVKIAEEFVAFLVTTVHLRNNSSSSSHQ